MLDLTKHWIPVGVEPAGWIAQCIGTREFVAVGKAHTKPLVFATAAQALLACENAERGDYDNAPPSTVWRVISDGVTTRAERNKALMAKRAAIPAVLNLTEVCEKVRATPTLGDLLKQRIAENEASRLPDRVPRNTLYGY